jgi:TonB family protein
VPTTTDPTNIKGRWPDHDRQSGGGGRGDSVLVVGVGARRPTPPRKLPISEFEVLYPAAALEQRTEGAVQVLFNVEEDGGVTDVRFQGPPLGRQLEASAVGAASLLIYSPAKVDGCPVPALLTYTVHYRER